MNQPSSSKPVDPLRDDPKTILADDTLSNAEKKVALENWRQDLIELQTATEENMPAQGGPAGNHSEQLSRVSEALRKLAGN